MPIKQDIEKDVVDIIRQADKGKKDSDKKINNKLRIIMYVTPFILAFMFYIYYYNNNPIETVSPEVIPEIVEEVEKIPIEISFQNIIENYEEFYDKEYLIMGFLGKEFQAKGSSGVYMEFITDDKGNKINLTSLTRIHQEFFIKDEITEDVFNVSGIFIRKYKNIELEVVNIIKADRLFET